MDLQRHQQWCLQVRFRHVSLPETEQIWHSSLQPHRMNLTYCFPAPKRHTSQRSKPSSPRSTAQRQISPNPAGPSTSATA